MWNKSKNFVRFQWERIDCSSHIIEVQPPTGRIGASHKLRHVCLDIKRVLYTVFVIIVHHLKMYLINLFCFFFYQEKMNVLILI